MPHRSKSARVARSVLRRRSASCLLLPRLTEAARNPECLEPSDHAHLQACPRCAELLRRLTAIEDAGVDDLGGDGGTDPSP